LVPKNTVHTRRRVQELMTSPQSPLDTGRRTGLLRRAAGEPLLQFLLLGAALFAVSAAISHWRDSSRSRIVVDAQLVEWQRNLYHAQFGTWPDSQALEALIQSYIREEALYREAVRLGLGSDDAVIRQRLAQKMEFVLTDATLAPEPGDQALQQFLAAHLDQYADSGRVSFHLLYFADTPDMEAGREHATQALQRLRAGEAGVRGDAFALSNEWSGTSADDLRRRFGESEMAVAPLHAPLEQWSGPYRSGYGWHLIRVTARAAGTAPKLDFIRGQVRSDWLADYRQRDLEARIAELIAKHRIVRQDRQAAP
jgi:peptidyl-prolyl cis-trans isomerase C